MLNIKILNMKRITYIFLLLTIVLQLLFLNGCKRAEDLDEFNFSYSFGIGGINKLNTYDGTFTKDLFTDGIVTITLNLTEEEKKLILDKMLEMDIFNFTGEYKEYILISPSTKNQLEIKYKDKVKKIYWSTNNIPIKSITPINPNEATDKDVKDLVEYYESEETKEILELLDLIALIMEILEDKEEYKQLPESPGGYM